MSFQYIPFQFSGLPRVRCAFQMRSSANSLLHRSGVEPLPMERLPVERSSVGVSGVNNSLAGNVSFVVKDDFDCVAKNRRSMQEELCIDRFAEVKQIHSDIIIFSPQATGFDEVVQVEADAMATNERKLALMIKTADCQSILVAHKDGKHVMGLHAGWRGNLMNFPKSSIERFCEHYQLNSKDLFVVRGPSLGPNMAEFTDFEKDWKEEFRAWYDEKSKCMDLWALTKDQVLSAGVLKNNIYSIDLCTSTMSDLFFSYRKDKNSGRQASLIWIE